jgi:NADH-quinone oxidoreductase subunit A
VPPAGDFGFRGGADEEILVMPSEQVLEYVSQYIPILLFIGVAVVFGVGTLLVSYLVQPRYPQAEKLSPYECGSEPFSDARMPFPVRYYIFAMLFVIFDIEIIFLYPWAVSFAKIGLVGLIEMLIFIGLFVVAYIYAWKKGALEWD